MAVRVVMPTFGLTEGEAVLVRWLKSVGETVRVDEALFEAENEKANLEVPAPADGVLLRTVVAEGEAAPLGELVAWIGEAGEQVPSGMQPEPTAPAPIGVPEEAVEPSADTWRRASPLARRLAREQGMELGALHGSGAGGRIVAADVERALAQRDNASQTQAPQTAGDDTVLPLTSLRRTTAQRLAVSTAQTVPVPLFVQVDMSEAQRLRAKTRADYEARLGTACSYNALVLRACALALPDYPELNGEWTERGVLVRRDIHIGLAVAVTGGLLVPVVHDATHKSLIEIQAEINQLVDAARDQRLSPQHLNGGTFSVTNLGNIGIDAFIPTINPPQTAILGVGRVAEQLVVVAGEAVVRPMATLCLVFDHRATDGAPAGACLMRIKQLLENPYLLA